VWPYLGHVLSCDSIIFETSGWFITRGLVLYRDFWDHKPPGIHLLDALALGGAGAALPGIKILQVLNAFILSAAFAACAFSYGCRTAATACGTLMMALCFYAPTVYQGGNRTEEYGATLVVLGLAMRQASDRWSCVAATTCLGLAPFLKEPFALSVAPWVAVEVWSRLTGPRRRAVTAATYLVAVAAPGLLIVAWLAACGGLCGWLDALAYNLFSYGERASITATLVSNIRPFVAHTTGMLPVSGPLFIAGVLAGARGSTEQSRAVVPLLAAQVACEYVATAIGGRHTETYYLQSIPTYMMIVTLGIDAVMRMHWPRLRWVSARGRDIVVIAIIGLAHGLPLVTLARAYAERPRSWPGNVAMAEAIRSMTDATARIWVPAVYRTDVYRLADRMPATRYFYIPGGGQGMDGPRVAGIEAICCCEHPTRAAQMESELKATIPQAIVLDAFSIKALEASAPAVLPWIEDRYAPVRRFSPINGHEPILLILKVGDRESVEGGRSASH
jgi:hypothetical protein